MPKLWQPLLFALLLVALAACRESICAAELLPADSPGHEIIDHYIDAKLQSDDVPTAPLVDDGNLIRRTMLDLAGRIPTTAEVRSYVDNSDANKRQELVEWLLDSPDCAYHHRNELDAMLLASEKNDDKWREYLLQATRENRPWDRLFREMMLGPTDEKDREALEPATEFLKARAKDLDSLTNEVSRMFFGVSINCAQCHDHPLVADWQQRHYFGFKSFFNRTYLTKSNRLAEKYSGEIKFKTTAGEEKLAEIMFLTGTAIEEPEIEKSKDQLKQEDAEVKRQMKDAKAPPPKPPEFSPRAKLVEIALEDGENQFFARSIVNRVWARFFGRGVVDPLDQMHSENPPSHPELMDWLARDLIAHGYDLKRLMGHIVLSNTYARSSRWDSDNAQPSADYFAVATPRVLSPRQYALSLIIATTNPTEFRADMAPEDWAKRREQLENASNNYAKEFELPTEHFQVSVDEALFFSNNDRVQNDFLRDSKDKLLGHLKEIEDRPEMIETAYWAIYSRAPDAEEIAWINEFLDQRQDRELEGLRHVVWALLSSPELRFNY